MFDPIIILFILTIALRDSVPDLLAGPQLDPAVLTVFVIGTLIGLVTLAYILNGLLLRTFDRTGSSASVRRIDRLSVVAKLALAVHWLASMLWLDWLGLIRDSVGNPILVDEVLAVLPFLAALFMCYGLLHGIQTRLREASMARWLAEGLPIPRPPSFTAYIVEAIRHRAAIILVPVVLLSGISEGLDRLFARATEHNPGFAESQWGTVAPELAQALLAITVLCAMPILLRVVWRTSSLADCPTRRRLEAMCRDQGVRVRDILIWHTSSGMLNGALIGVLPRVRYILLTDALLERMPGAQLEAVMAHEIAHARRHHLPWLLVTMVGVVTVCSTGFWLVVRPVLLRIEDLEQRLFWSDLVSGVAIGIALICAFFVFGWLSRRFERQADAFATQHLSGVRFRRDTEVPQDRCEIISGPAANAMKQALATVAATSGIPRERFSYRHGSIAARQHAIDSLVCRPARRLPIDRKIRRIKIASAVLVLAAIGLSVVQVRLDQADRDRARVEAIDQWFEQAGIPRWLRPKAPSDSREVP